MWLVFGQDVCAENDGLTGCRSHRRQFFGQAFGRVFVSERYGPAGYGLSRRRVPRSNLSWA
jgi:hypothetical protein